MCDAWRAATSKIGSCVFARSRSRTQRSALLFVFFFQFPFPLLQRVAKRKKNRRSISCSAFVVVAWKTVDYAFVKIEYPSRWHQAQFPQRRPRAIRRKRNHSNKGEVDSYHPLPPHHSESRGSGRSDLIRGGKGRLYMIGARYRNALYCGQPTCRRGTEEGHEVAGYLFWHQTHLRRTLEIMSNWAKSIINGLRCPSDTVRGLSQPHLRILYKACVIPVMTHASAMWYRAEKRQMALMSVLEVAQNKALRLISGGFRTSRSAIQALSHVPPIRLTLERLSNRAAIRLSKLPFSSFVSQRLPNSWRDDQPPSAYVPFPPLDVYLTLTLHISPLFLPSCRTLFPLFRLLCPSVNPLLTSSSFSTCIEPTSPTRHRRFYRPPSPPLFYV